MAAQFVAVLPPRETATVADLDAVGRLDQATSRWRQPPCFVTLVGSGNASAIAAGVLGAGGGGKLAPEDVPFAQSCGCVIVPTDAADSEASKALPINLLNAPLDSQSIAVCSNVSDHFKVAQLAAALAFRGTVVMCVARGEYESALAHLASAAQLSNAIRPRGFDGSAAAGACHLVVLDASPGVFTFDTTGAGGDGATPHDGGGGGGSNYFTRLETVGDGPSSSGAGVRTRNAQRLAIELAFVTTSVEVVPATEITSGGDRFRRLIGRIVAKARASPVTSRAVQPLVATTTARISQVLQESAASQRKADTPTQSRASTSSDAKGGADWARAVAKGMLESEFVKWSAVQISTSNASEAELDSQFAAVLHRCCALHSLWGISATEQRLFSDAARAHLVAAQKDLKRRNAAKANPDDTFGLGGAAGARQRGAQAASGGGGSLFSQVFRLPPADQIPACLKFLEPQVPLQHRFWLSWTGLLTIFVLAFFVITTLLLMRKGG